MSVENHIDPRVLPAYLPILTLIEGMIIARSYIQIVLLTYCQICLLNSTSWSYGLWIMWRMRLGIGTSSGRIFGFGRVTSSPGSGS